MNKLILVILLVLLVASCSPAGYMDTDVRITCYSYGETVYEGIGRFQMQNGLSVFVENESGKTVLLHEFDCKTEILQ